jgi:hypothetical protein
MITKNGVTKRLGTFNNADEAHEAYIKARQELLA